MIPAPSNSENKPCRRNLLTAAVLAIAAWLLYLPSLTYDFIYYDDVRILKDHPELYGQATLAENLKGIFVTHFPREEPLLIRDVSWALDSLLFGFGNPLGYHLGNVLLHGLVVALLFAFLLGLARDYKFALAVAGGYLVLALHVEPVAWIMGRKDILSALFMLAALCAQAQRLKADRPVPQCGWYLVTLLCFVLGLLSKISVLTFPLVLFLHAVLLPYLRDGRDPGAPLRWDAVFWREALLCVPTFAVSCAIYVWYQRTLEQMGVFERGYTAQGLEHLWNLAVVNPMGFWVYLRQVFLPSPQGLYYLWPADLVAYPAWQVTASLATIAGIAGLGAWLLRRRKDLFFFFGAFFVLMVPYLNLFYIGIWVADRYLYFSVFCVLALAVKAGISALQQNQPAARIAVVVAGVAFVGTNLYHKISYQPAWRNAETLWQFHIALPDPAPGAYENLAAYYYAEAVSNQGKPSMVPPLRKMAAVVDAGLKEYWPDRKQPPPRSTAHLLFLQAILHEILGQPEAALASLLASDQLRPRFDFTKLNLARLYRAMAKASGDPSQRQAYARSARERFAEYIALAYRGRSAPPEVAREQAEIETEYQSVTR